MSTERDFRFWVAVAADGSTERVLDAATRLHPEVGPAVSSGAGRMTLVFSAPAADAGAALALGWRISAEVLREAGLVDAEVTGFELETLEPGGELEVRLTYFPEAYLATSSGARSSNAGAFVAELVSRSGIEGTGSTADDAIEDLAAQLAGALGSEGYPMDLIAQRDDGSLESRLAALEVRGRLVTELKRCAGAPVVATDARMPESADFHIAEFYCPACDARYEAAGDPADLRALSCWFCPSMLVEQAGSSHFAAPAERPRPGHPVLTLTSRPSPPE